MKDLKIYKSAMALVLTGTITLFSGCSSSTNTEKEEKEVTCRHLIIYFDDQPITFKECDGYNISTHRFGYSSEINYEIKKENKILFNGTTTNYNSYCVDHEFADKNIQNESIQKTK